MSYTEYEYERAFISMLEGEGWQYLSGSSITRNSLREVLYLDDMEKFLSKFYPELSSQEIHKIIDQLRLIGAQSEFAVLHKVYLDIVNGFQFIMHGLKPIKIKLIDFDTPQNNIFRVVNQFPVEYSDNGRSNTRRPDILLFVNGIPLCIIELKNPAGNDTIYDAWEQIYYRYWRDIPNLLHYCQMACISDGVHTRLGTVRTLYEHFYSWRKVNDFEKISHISYWDLLISELEKFYSADNDDNILRSGSVSGLKVFRENNYSPYEETESMIKGVFSPSRFLEILRDYIYFPDSIYDNEEQAVICRYPQFFASRLLKQSIIKSITEENGKGGTYFGATGCGKTFTMAFLARQLSMRCPEIGSPTIIIIVDREDLQKQAAKLFTRSTEFLNIGEVR